MKSKKKRGCLVVLTALASIILFCVIAGVIGYSRSRAKGSGSYVYTDEVRTIADTGDQGLGTVQVSTLPLDASMGVRRAVYSFSGRVLIGYNDGANSVICSVNDDGTDLKELYRGVIRSSYRLLPYADNTRILLGDYVLECPKGTTLDTCQTDAAILVPIHFPASFSEDAAVTDKWTETIISQDCEHIAWTIRRSDCGAVNAMGRLVRTESAYEIVDAVYISQMNPLSDDPEHPGCSLYTPVIGGEVKQFVRGGAAISLVGSDPCGMADSVVQDVASGKVTQLTFAPGYDETTILSPDEQLGIVMTTRFSDTTDMAALGLVPRPIGQPLHNILGQVYMYGVTGVRGGRAGNIGPALVNLSRSMSERDYRGIDLSDPSGEWVYLSPMSWKNDSTRAMWIERQREGHGYRVQIATLVDYIPGKAVETVQTPAVGSYATEPAKSFDFDTTVRGKVSGSVHMTKKSGFLGSATVSVTYDNYSDDGVYFYTGTETSSGSIMSKTTYTADLVVKDASGRICGTMQTDMRLGAAYSIPNLIEGNNSPHLDTAHSFGTATWETRAADMTKLVP